MRLRRDSTITSQLWFALPCLRSWATSHESLREIGRDDVLAVLPPRGRPRASMVTALRSIFRVLKSHDLVFVNLLARISVPTSGKQLPPPDHADQPNRS